MEQNPLPGVKASSKSGMIAFVVFLVGSVGIALWMMISDIWQASALINLQADWFNGEYYPKMTFAIVWMLLLLTFMAVVSIASWIKRTASGKK